MVPLPYRDAAGRLRSTEVKEVFQTSGGSLAYRNKKGELRYLNPAQVRQCRLGDPMMAGVCGKGR